MARITSEGPSQMKVQIIPDIDTLNEVEFKALLIKLQGDRMSTIKKERKPAEPKEKKSNRSNGGGKPMVLDISKLG